MQDSPKGPVALLVHLVVSMIGTTNTTIADLVHQLIIYQNATKMTIVDLVHRLLPLQRLRKSVRMALAERREPRAGVYTGRPERSDKIEGVAHLTLRDYRLLGHKYVHALRAPRPRSP